MEVNQKLESARRCTEKSAYDSAFLVAPRAGVSRLTAAVQVVDILFPHVIKYLRNLFES
jgi:hypothetical protein